MKKSQTLTLYEYEKGEFNRPISQQTSLALNKTIDSLSTHLKSRVFEPILNHRNETVGIRAAQFVGVVRIDNYLTVEIIPKMYRGQDSADDRAVNINNLFFMLDYCNQLSMPHQSSSKLAAVRGSFFETLIYLFASNLLDCIQNSAHQEYISNQENKAYLRGKLLIAEHLSINHVNQSMFYTESDDFSSDNELNRILKYVAKMLLSSSNSTVNKNLLAKIITIYGDVTDSRRVTLQDSEQITLTRLNGRFEQSLKMAKLFLASKSVQLSVKNYDSFTFLIDMNQLFEEFIATVIKKAIRKSDLRQEFAIKTQGPIKPLVDYTSQSDRGVFQMKPDITVIKNGIPYLIIDTKYKMLKDDRKLGVLQSDLYQMYAYANKYRVSDVMLLYPKRDDDSVRATDFHIDESCAIKIRFASLNDYLNQRTALELEEDLLKMIRETIEFASTLTA